MSCGEQGDGGMHEQGVLVRHLSSKRLIATLTRIAHLHDGLTAASHSKMRVDVLEQARALLAPALSAAWLKRYVAG